MRRLPQGMLAVTAMLAVGLVFAGIGVYNLLVQENGTAASASVTECKDSSYYSRGREHTTTKCTGYWILGGPLGDGPEDLRRGA
jgi:hypothetical protein